MSYNRCLQIFNAKYSCSNSTIKVTTKFQQPTSLLAQRELVVKQGLHLGWKFQFGTQHKYFFYCTDSTPITIVSIVSICQLPSSCLLLIQSCPRMATMLKNANSWLSPRANLSLCCWQNSIWQPANQVHKYILWPKRQQFRIWWFLSVFIDLAVSLFFNVLVQNIYFAMLSGRCQQKYPELSFLSRHPHTSLRPMCSFLPWVSNSTNPKWTPKICLKMYCFTIPKKLDQPTGWIHNCQITHVTKHQFNNPARMLKVAILTWKEVHPPKKVHHRFRFGHGEAHI